MVRYVWWGNTHVRSPAQAGIAVTANSTVVDGRMSVAMQVVQTEKSNGYLFAKSSASGGLRHWSLYSKPGRVQFYYLTRARSRHLTLNFDVDLTDARPVAGLGGLFTLCSAHARADSSPHFRPKVTAARH